MGKITRRRPKQIASQVQDRHQKTVHLDEENNHTTERGRTSTATSQMQATYEQSFWNTIYFYKRIM